MDLSRKLFYCDMLILDGGFQYSQGKEALKLPIWSKQVCNLWIWVSSKIYLYMMGIAFFVCEYLTGLISFKSIYWVSVISQVFWVQQWLGCCPLGILIYLCVLGFLVGDKRLFTLCFKFYGIKNSIFSLNEKVERRIDSQISELHPFSNHGWLGHFADFIFSKPLSPDNPVWGAHNCLHSVLKSSEASCSEYKMTFKRQRI